MTIRHHFLKNSLFKKSDRSAKTVRFFTLSFAKFGVRPGVGCGVGLGLLKDKIKLILSEQRGAKLQNVQKPNT